MQKLMDEAVAEDVRNITNATNRGNGWSQPEEDLQHLAVRQTRLQTVQSLTSPAEGKSSLEPAELAS